MKFGHEHLSDLSSVLSHERGELIKKCGDVVGTGTCFRMSLKTHGRSIEKFQPLQRPVKKTGVNPGYIFRKCRFIDGKAVVLTCNRDAMRTAVRDRVVGPVVTEFHLDGLSPGGKPHNLMA